MSLVDGVTLLAAALTLVAGVPQMLTSLRSSTAGVSAGTWATLTGVGALWTAWAVPSGVWPMVVSEGCFTVCSAVIAVRCAGPWRAAFMAGAASAALYGTWALGGATALGGAAVAGSIACRVPQLVKAWRSPDVSGVSPGSWALLLAASAAWAVAGIAKADVVLFLGGALSAASSVLVIALVRMSARRRNRAAAST